MEASFCCWIYVDIKSKEREILTLLRVYNLLLNIMHNRSNLFTPCPIFGHHANVNIDAREKRDIQNYNLRMYSAI